ncbi:hypothetical protein PMAYCL1PPCAC_10043, partial [Pristionchus mayeri]
GPSPSLSIQLSNGRSYPNHEMEKLVKLMEKHAHLLNSADPDKMKEGYENVNEEGKECSWHVQDKCLKVTGELSALWHQLSDYAKSINVESLDDEKDDGGMEHKLYDQIVDYFKTGKIPYENYTRIRDAKYVWTKKCSQYTLADDGQTLNKGRAVVLKRGEVINAISNYHQICGHSNYDKMLAFLSQLFFPSGNNLMCSYVASCSCGYITNINFNDLKVLVKNTAGGRREIMVLYGKDDCDRQEMPKKTLNITISYGITDTEYEKEFMRARLSSSSKFKIARDGKTLVTSSGAIVLKNEEAVNVCMRIHELCGHPKYNEMTTLVSRFLFVPIIAPLCAAVMRKCTFCRCKSTNISIISASPVNFQDVSLDINVHYDEGTNERRFQIITHGVDRDLVDNYVKSTTDRLKSYGKWKEPVFSPSAALAREVLRAVDLLKGDEEKIDDVIDFDPIHNDTLSTEEVNISETDECGTGSETVSDKESVEDEMSSDEEDEDEMEEEDEEIEDEDEEEVEYDEEESEYYEDEGESEYDEDEEESYYEDGEGSELYDEEEDEDEETEEEEVDDEEDLEGEEDEETDDEEWDSDWEDEELREMRRAYKQQQDEIELMKYRLKCLRNGRMGMEAYKRQWEWSDYLHEELRARENPHLARMANEDEEESGESEGEAEVAPSDDQPGPSGLGFLPEERKHQKSRKERRKLARMSKKKKGKGENRHYDLPPYQANYEVLGHAQPNVANTVQLERVEMEQRDNQPILFAPPPLSQSALIARKRERLANLRKEKDELERNTKKAEREYPLPPLHNPYAAVFNGNLAPPGLEEKLRKLRLDRQRRKDAGLTASEEDEEECEE